MPDPVEGATPPTRPLAGSEPDLRPATPDLQDEAHTGDPGRRSETFRIRLQVKGQWRFVRGEYYADEGAVDFYGNDDVGLYSAAVPSLGDAIQTGAALALAEFNA